VCETRTLYDPDELFVKSEALQLWTMQRDDSVWTGELLAGNRQLGKMLSICVRSGSAGACYGRVRSEEHTLEAQVDYALDVLIDIMLAKGN
jgi:hypothetical protein